MKKIDLSNDPIVRANQRKIIKKRIIIKLITLLASILFIVGFLIFVLGSQIKTMSCLIAGGIICGAGVVVLFIMGIFYYGI